MDAAVSVVSIVHGQSISYFEMIDKTCQNEIEIEIDVNKLGK